MDAPALGGEERSDEAPRAGASNARAPSDPEVVAKPKRRAVVPVHSGVSAADPRGGRALHAARRSGSAASPRGAVQLPHLTDWRKARRQGSLRGLTPSKRGRKRAERNPLRAQVHELEAKVARLEKELAHRPYDPGRPGKSCRAAGIQPRTREGLLMAVQPLASQVGVTPACRALGVPRATFYRRRRPAPGHRQPRPASARALCASERAITSSTCFPARASSTGHRPRSSRRCSMKASIRNLSTTLRQ